MINSKTIHWILLIGLLVGSLFVFFYGLKTVPGGLFPDASANGLDANLLRAGEHTPFFERGNGRESLFFYLMAGAIGLFGVSNWSILIPGALIGFLIVLGTYLLAKEWFNSSVGLVAGLMTAVSYWLIIISRSGFRAILVPLFLIYFFYFLSLAVKRESWAGFFGGLAGLMFGLGFYSYISYRMVIVLGIFFLVLLLIAKYSDKKNYAVYSKISWWFVLLAVIAIIPLSVYFVQHPDAIVGRAGQVSVFNADLNQGDLIGTIWTELKKNVLAFWGGGDLNWRHNISGYPMIGIMTGILFLGGLILFLFKSLSFLRNLFSRESFNGLEYFLAFFTFWLMMVPAVMSAEGSPHGLRLLGCLPFVMIMAGWFLIACYGYAQKAVQAGWLKKALPVGLALIVVFITFSNLWLFWTNPAQSDEYYYAFRKDLTYASDYLNQRNDRDNTFLVLDEYSLQTPEFLTSENDQPYRAVMPDQVLDLKLKKGQSIVFTSSSLDQVDLFEKKNWDLEIVERVNNQQSIEKEELIRVYEK